MKLKDIGKSFGEKIVFNGFSADIANGSVTWIMGRSGCGKTTLLRIMAGLEAFEGTITDVPEGRISFVFQEDRLFEELSALDNCLAVCGRSYRDEAAKMLLSAGLSSDDIRATASSLSGGMKRRTAIVRALCAEGGLVLMDEPFAGLDDGTKKLAAKLISEKCHDRTLIIVTHDREDTVLLGGNIIDL